MIQTRFSTFQVPTLSLNLLSGSAGLGGLAHAQPEVLYLSRDRKGICVHSARCPIDPAALTPRQSSAGQTLCVTG